MPQDISSFWTAFRDLIHDEKGSTMYASVRLHEVFCPIVIWGTQLNALDELLCRGAVLSVNNLVLSEQVMYQTGARLPYVRAHGLYTGSVALSTLHLLKYDVTCKVNVKSAVGGSLVCCRGLPEGVVTVGHSWVNCTACVSQQENEASPMHQYTRDACCSALIPSMLTSLHSPLATELDRGIAKCVVHSQVLASSAVCVFNHGLRVREARFVEHAEVDLFLEGMPEHVDRFHFVGEGDKLPYSEVPSVIVEGKIKILQVGSWWAVALLPWDHALMTFYELYSGGALRHAAADALKSMDVSAAVHARFVVLSFSRCRRISPRRIVDEDSCQ
eukprot:439909-Amphidinium_carterae.3